MESNRGSVILQPTHHEPYLARVLAAVEAAEYREVIAVLDPLLTVLASREESESISPGEIVGLIEEGLGK